MAEPLKYKAEKCIAEFIGNSVGWKTYTGQNPNEAPPPCILVYASGQSEAFPDSLPKEVKMTVEVVSGFDLDDNSNNIAGESADRSAGFDLHRETVQKVEARLQDSAALIAFANSTNTTNRPITGFYVYDIFEDSQQSSMSGEDRMLISSIGITLVCEAQDN
jgi:hypothetical protein